MPTRSSSFGICSGALVALLLAISASAQTGYQQVLVPFDTMAATPGQLGALWSAELWVRNDSSDAVNLFPEKCYSFGREYPCDRQIYVSGNSSRLVDVFERDSLDHPGVMLYVPDTHVADIHFSLRVRDVSKQSSSAGTEIPIVRPSDLLLGRATLLNVPLRAGFRARLRVYGSAWRAFVRVYRQDTNELLGTREFSQPQPTDMPSPAWVPEVFDFTAALDDVLPNQPVNVRVVVETAASYVHIWPLLTITNNATQEITVVTAQ